MRAARPVRAARRRWSALAVALCAGAASADPDASEALATLAVAQQAPDAAAPAVPAAPLRQVQEIVVTAQKVEQSARDVPISVTAMDGDFMRTLGAAAIADISSYVPNLKFSSESEPVLTQFSIRGFGTSPLNSAFESSVGFVQDELFLGRPTYALEGMFDVDRIEVLRGPQGTLFGKNTTAGVFNVVSRGPAEDFSADLRVAVSDPEERRLEGGAGGMFAGWGGARVALLNVDHPGGETRNTSLDRDEDAYHQRAERLKVLLLPHDGVAMDVTVQHSSTHGTYWPLQLSDLADSTMTFLRTYDARVEDDGYDHQASEDFAGFVKKTSTTGGVVTTWDIGPFAGMDRFSTTVVLGASKMGVDAPPDLDTSPADIARLRTTWDHRQRTAEWRFNGAFGDGLFGWGDGLDFIAGAFFYDADFFQTTRVAAGRDIAAYAATGDAARQISGGTTTLPLPGLGLLGELLAGVTGPLVGDDSVTLDYGLDTRTVALFGQATWHLDEHWAVTPGVRVNFEKKKVDATGESACTAPPLCIMRVALAAQDYDARGLHRSESDVSPKVSLQYFVDGDITLFASVARGYKSGGFNGASFDGKNLEFEPENVVAWEAGVKSALFGRTVSFNLTAFYENFRDLQTLSIDGAFINVGNAATAISQGLEMDFLWLTPLPFLGVSGTLGVLDAHYDSYPDGQATSSMPAGSTQDLGGRTLPFAPHVSSTLSPTVTLPVLGVLAVSSVDWIYASAQYTDIDLDPHTRVPAHSLLSARISLVDPNQRWTLTIGGSNLTDEDYAGQVVDAAFFPGGYNVTQQPGRRLFAAFSLRY